MNRQEEITRIAHQLWKWRLAYHEEGNAESDWREAEQLWDNDIEPNIGRCR
jgi:hypothetical protein